MTTRVYVKLKDKVTFVDSYLISHKFSNDKLKNIAASLTNPILEEYSIDKFPKVGNFSFAIEIGFLPGVTDNISHTVKETITDLLRLKDSTDFAIYTSKIFLIKEKMNEEKLQE